VPICPSGGGGSGAGRGDVKGLYPAGGQEKLLKQDLDGSLASLAGNLSIRPTGQIKK